MKREKAMAETRQKELRQALEGFRSTHPEKTLKREKALWRYRSGGSGKEAVMLLAGALGRGEAFFLHADRLEERFRVLIPDYPAAGVDELADGLLEIMDREDVVTCHLIAQSLGGLIAQELLRRAPKRIGNIVLSHTATVSGDMEEPDIEEIRRDLLKTRGLLEKMPFGLLKPLFKMRIGRMLKGKNPGETRFWKGYFSDLIGGLDRERELALQSAMLEFVETRRYRPEDFEAWKGRMLIVQSDGDRAFEARQKEALSRLFPEARRHVFEKGGHLAILFEREAFMALAMGHLEASAYQKKAPRELRGRDGNLEASVG